MSVGKWRFERMGKYFTWRKRGSDRQSTYGGKLTERVAADLLQSALSYCESEGYTVSIHNVEFGIQVKISGLRSVETKDGSIEIT